MRPNVLLRTVSAAVLSAVLAFPGLASASASEVPCNQHTDARLAEMSDAGIGLTTSLGLAAGRYALPASATPTQLVVMFHGHGNDSCSWRNHLRDAASRGAVAVAMDYSDQEQTPSENYGWAVRSGAADSINAARYFLGQYPSITKVIAFGISMGGNVAGYAIASPEAKRADNTPLFDYLIDVEGANDLLQEYLIVRAIESQNKDAALAKEEIERENGGNLEDNPDAYIATTNIFRAREMAYLRGAVIVHGIDDGLVPTVQSPEMSAALTAAGVPVHTCTVVLKGSGEAGTTGSGIAATPALKALGQSYQPVTAGHGWEGSDTHLVIKTGFDRLWQMLAGAGVEAGATLVPGA